MRVAVAGGTGLTGRALMEALARSGHEGISLSRESGVDAVAGTGLDQALAGADALVDVTNLPAGEVAEARTLFGAATRNLLAAGARAGVGHHVLLSIVGVDRMEGPPHYAGKRLQEELVSAGPVPFTILRATQFHEFAEMVAGWMSDGEVALVPPARVQPVAVADVAETLARVATGPSQGRAPDLAGPRPEDLAEMARRTMEVRPGAIRVVASWDGGLFSADMPPDILMPGPEAELAPTTFDRWLAGISASGGR
jgi:uncharacterized protein YbjT (DUF2867 family)